MALTQISTQGIKDGTISSADLADQSVTLAKLPHGTSSNNGKFLRANNGADPTFETVSTDLVNDTSPQLGGNLDTNGNIIIFPDSNGTTNRLIFGTNKFEMYYDSGNSRMQIDNITGDFSIRNQASGGDIDIIAGDDIRIRPQGGENGINLVGNGAVELYHDNSKRIETTAFGVKVTGGGPNNPTTDSWETNSSIITSGSFGGGIAMIDGSAGFVQSLDGNGANYYLRNATTTSTPETSIKAIANGAVELYHNNIKTFETTGEGVTFDTGSSSCVVRLTSNTDAITVLQAFNSDFLIKAPSGGDVSILTNANESSINCISNGAVELYHDNSKKFETTSSGATLSGTQIIQAGAFSSNVTTGNKTFTANIDIRATSMRGGVVVRNMNDFRSDSVFNASFMHYDPFDTTATSTAFRVARGATLADTFSVRSDGRTFIGERLGIGESSPTKTLVLSENDSECVAIIKSSDTGAAGVFLGGQSDEIKGGIIFDNSNNKLTLRGHNNSIVQTIDSSGRVGIGDGNPSDKFVISAANSQLRLIDSDDSKFVQFSYSGGKLITRNNSTNTTTAQFTLDESGRLGIGTISPNGEIDLGSSSSGRKLTFSNYSNLFSEHSSGALWLSSNFYGNAGASGFKTGITGNFGAAAISVNATGGSSNSGIIEFFTDANASKTAGGAFTPTERMRITHDGNVSIGSTSNVAPLNVRAMTDGNLHVRPITSIHSGTGVGLDILNNANNAVKDLAIRAATTVFKNASAESMRITAGGNVEITNLCVAGAGLTQFDNAQSLISQSSIGSSTQTYFIGNQAIQTSSDRRIKENIVDTKIDASSELKKVRVVDFTWNDPNDKAINNRNSRGKWTGCIAQEIVDVFPFAVNAPRPEGKEIDHDSGALWGMEYGQLVPVLIKGFQEAIACIETLETKVAALEAS